MHISYSLNTPPRRGWLVVGLLATCLGLPLAAYQQGSFFLFDIREDAPASGTAGRIVVAASAFKTGPAKPATQAAGPSEFETRITSFGSDGSTLKSSGVQLLEVETDAPKIESSFGDEPPVPSGFFFTY